tara:strand:- start:478 stop:714 length:237 start_codon:yes stop_codon:yes gene_type:complete
MENKSRNKLILAYTGNELSTKFLKNDLQDAGINSLIKSETESARLAGFGSSIFSGSQLFIYELDIDNAKPIITEFLNK